MINIEQLTEKDVGRNVTYTDGKKNKEFGHITSWNKKFIFVDYGPRCCGRGIATYPKDLTWG
jgi:hypothetical protein